MCVADKDRAERLTKLYAQLQSAYGLLIQDREDRRYGIAIGGMMGDLIMLPLSHAEVVKIAERRIDDLKAEVRSLERCA